jgi:hypothetical protein
MTEEYPSTVTQPSEYAATTPISVAGSTAAGVPLSGSPDAGGSDSTTDVAKNQAAEVGHGAVDAGQHVAAVAKDQASNVTAEAGRQAQDLLHQTRGELTGQATQQQQRLAGNLHSIADELHSMASKADQPGVATDMVRQASTKAHTIASWLEDREPADVLEDVKTFARQRPGTFLLLAAGLGLVAGRMTRGLKDSSSGGSSGASSSGAATYPTAAPSVGYVEETAPPQVYLEDWATEQQLVGEEGTRAYSAPPEEVGGFRTTGGAL